MSLVYYNEFDKKKCAALKQLMADGHIAKGDIDDRSIREVQASELTGYTRCHFFAGIGLWEYALQLAGWPDDRQVWTGSCPCQPYSTAGRQKAQEDDRHLWPEWLRLIRECRPSAIFGEQVANAITHGWLDDVYQGLECEGYAVGAAVLPACSVGAPHRRERLFFAARTNWQRVMFTAECDPGGDGWCQVRNIDPAECDCIGPTQDDVEYCELGGELCARHVGNSIGEGLEGHADNVEISNEPGRLYTQQGGSAWASGVWTECPDGKARLVEPGIPLLAHGYPERVGIIHCAGDAIVPQVAAEFITASMEY